jgi:hypothetical protein
MAIFPESARRKPQYGYDNTPEDNIKRTPPEAGNSYIRDSWGGLRWTARMDFLVSRADANIIWAFYLLSRLSSFTIFDFETSVVTAVSIGTGNGVLTDFTIPGKEVEASGLLVYKNAVATALYTKLVGTGSQGEDQIRFATAPANGVALTLTGTLRRRYTVEFAERATRNSPSFDRVHISMKVQERFPLS